MRLPVIVASEGFEIVESGMVSPEGSEESFDLALGCGFSNPTHDVLDLMVLTEVCELA